METVGSNRLVWFLRGRKRTDDLSASIRGFAPPPPGSSGPPNYCDTDSGRGDSARTLLLANAALVVHVLEDVAA